MQDEVVSSFEFYAGQAEKLDKEGDQDLNVPDETLKIVVRREPLGVCALITPWNVSPYILVLAHVLLDAIFQAETDFGYVQSS